MNLLRVGRILGWWGFLFAGDCASMAVKSRELHPSKQHLDNRQQQEGVKDYDNPGSKNVDVLLRLEFVLHLLCLLWRLHIRIAHPSLRHGIGRARLAFCPLSVQRFHYSTAERRNQTNNKSPLYHDSTEGFIAVTCRDRLEATRLRLTAGYT